MRVRPAPATLPRPAAAGPPTKTERSHAPRGSPHRHHVAGVVSEHRDKPGRPHGDPPPCSRSTGGSHHVTPTAASLPYLAEPAGPRPVQHASAGLLTPTSPTDKQGSRWLRWTLVEAATSAVRDPQLGRF